MVKRAGQNDVDRAPSTQRRQTVSFATTRIELLTMSAGVISPSVKAWREAQWVMTGCPITLPSAGGGIVRRTGHLSFALAYADNPP
jgi:hypothetical protein